MYVLSWEGELDWKVSHISVRAGWFLLVSLSVCFTPVYLNGRLERYSLEKELLGKPDDGLCLLETFNFPQQTVVWIITLLYSALWSHTAGIHLYFYFPFYSSISSALGFRVVSQEGLFLQQARKLDSGEGFLFWQYIHSFAGKATLPRLFSSFIVSQISQNVSLLSTSPPQPLNLFLSLSAELSVLFPSNFCQELHLQLLFNSVHTPLLPPIQMNERAGKEANKRTNKYKGNDITRCNSSTHNQEWGKAGKVKPKVNLQKL